jgi:hypothetical protein
MGMRAVPSGYAIQGAVLDSQCTEIMGSNFIQGMNGHIFLCFPVRIEALRWTYVVVSKCFQTGHLEQESQMVQLSATRCSHIAIL